MSQRPEVPERAVVLVQGMRLFMVSSTRKTVVISRCMMSVKEDQHGNPTFNLRLVPLRIWFNHNVERAWLWELEPFTIYQSRSMTIDHLWFFHLDGAFA